MDQTQLVDGVERDQRVARQRPPVRAILEDIAQQDAVALEPQQRGPVVDGDAGVVGLHQGRPVGRAAIELHDLRHGLETVADEAGEDAPLALGPLAEVAVGRGEEALGVATALAGGRCFAKDLDVVAGDHP